MKGDRVALARWLADAGAGVSARRALGDMRGAPANRLRIAADRATLRPGFFALVALPDGRGLALPLVPALGRTRATDPAFREACGLALGCARELLDAPSLPALRFELEEELAIFGPSIGLGAALAFLAHFMPSRAPDRAILATGRLLEGGRVATVGHVRAKAEIAAAERGARLVLLPPEGEAVPQDDGVIVGTLREAATLAFGPAPWRAGAGFWTIDDLLRRARSASDPLAGVALLEGVTLDALALADRVRVLFDLGTLHRNAGNSRRAWELHERARASLDEVRVVVGSDVAERCELEHAASALDELWLDRALAWLRRRLAEPFLRARNELRCRGMLAQGLAIAGAFDEALAVRGGNLALHERSAGLAKSLPMTLCQLAMDAAFAGRDEVFDAHAARLVAVTPPGEDHQARFNSAAIVRGLVALGRGAEALAWAEDRRPFHGARIAATLAQAALGPDPIAALPELTTARALVRALREAGELERAHRLAERALAARESLPVLFRWTASLVRLEQAITFRSAGRDKEARASLEIATREMLGSHPRATAHFGLTDAPLGPALSERVSRVWF